MRRAPVVVGTAAALATATGLAFGIGPAQASVSGPGVHVVVSHLGNPRGLSMSAGGALYVAEAGRGSDGSNSSHCFTDPAMGPKCAGLTGSIDRVREGAVTRIVSGLISISSPGGIAATGVVAVSASGGKVYGQFGRNTSGVRAARLPSYLARAASRDLGQFGWVASDGFRPVAGVGDHDFAWAARHKYLVPDQFPDANPNGVLIAHGGVRYVVDAGANTLDEVTAAGAVRVLAFLPAPDGSVTDAVPTCVAAGPDGALYVGELLGGNPAPGHARVWRIAVNNGNVTKKVWARGLTTIQGCGFDRSGNFYATEFQVHGLDFSPSASPLGAVVKITQDGRRSMLGSGRLFWPSGFAAGPRGSVYVSNCSIAPASGFGPCPDGGQVVRIG